MSKIILIQRQVSFSQMAHTEPEVLDWFSQSFRAVGPYWKGKVVASGLSHPELRLLMPFVHNVEAEDKEFRKVTDRYFEEILTKIPVQGLRLEIGLEDDSKPLSITNLPLNKVEYVTYRHAIGHPGVAPNKDEAERNPLKTFYIYDPTATAELDVDLNKLEDAAIKSYFDVKDDELKVDQILTMMAIDIRRVSFADKIVKLKQFTKRNMLKGEADQKQLLDNFIKVCTDKDLEMKYLIHELVGAQVLEKVGTNILVKESGKSIGENMDDAVLFLNNPKNSKDLNLFRAHYENVVNKGSRKYSKAKSKVEEPADKESEAK